GSPARTGARPRSRRFEGAAIAIVQFALARVVQDVVGRLDLLELLLGRLVVGIQVGVVFPRQTAIGFLNVSLRGVAFDPEDFVVIVSHVFEPLVYTNGR